MPIKCKLFGLMVESPFEFLETPTIISAETPDVIIKLGKVSLDIRNHPDATFYEDKIGYYIPNTNQMFFLTPTVAYEVINGKEIIIETFANNEHDVTIIYLLGVVFGCLQAQRGKFPIHGSSLLIDKKAVIITGHSGAGKSTVNSALVAKGYPFISDDVSTLEVEHGVAMITPSYPQRKLCEDACLQLGYDISKLRLVGTYKDKYAINSIDSWHSESAPFGYIVELVKGDCNAKLEVVAIEGINKMNLLMHNAFHPLTLKKLGIHPTVTKKIAVAASQIKAFRLIRPDGVRSLDEVVDLLCAEMSPA